MLPLQVLGEVLAWTQFAPYRHISVLSSDKFKIMGIPPPRAVPGQLEAPRKVDEALCFASVDGGGRLELVEPH